MISLGVSYFSDKGNPVDITHLGVTYIDGVRILGLEATRLSVMEIRGCFDIRVIERSECQRCAVRREPQR